MLGIASPLSACSLRIGGDVGGASQENKRRTLMPPPSSHDLIGSCVTPDTSNITHGGCCISFFDDRICITPYLTSRILDSMHGRTVLEENKFEILSCLQNIYNIVIKTESPEPAPPKILKPNRAKPKPPTPIVMSAEFLYVVSSNLQTKTCLSVHETQLLGQLAVVNFRNIKDAALILLPSFTMSKHVHIPVCHHASTS